MFNSQYSKALFGGIIAISVLSGASAASAMIGNTDRSVSAAVSKSISATSPVISSAPSTDVKAAPVVAQPLPIAQAATAAGDVASGVFGTNTGGGNYSFPAKLSIGTVGAQHNLDIAGGAGSGRFSVDLSDSPLVTLKAKNNFGSHIEFNNSVGDWQGSIGTNDAAIDGFIGGMDVVAGPGRKLGLFAGGGAGSIWLTPTGNVAIGPYWQNAYKLKVSGNLYAENNFLLTSTGPTMSRMNIVSGSGIADIEMRSNNYSWYFGNRGANENPNSRLSIFNSGLTETFTILPNGNVGVGKSNPAQKLEVAGTIYSSIGGFRFPDGTVQTTAANSGNSAGRMAVTSGAPSESGCDAKSETGAMSLDAANNRLYVCNMVNGGWQYSALAN